MYDINTITNSPDLTPIFRTLFKKKYINIKTKKPYWVVREGIIDVKNKKEMIEFTNGYDYYIQESKEFYKNYTRKG